MYCSQYFSLPQPLPLLSAATSFKKMKYVIIWLTFLWTLVSSYASKFLIVFQPLFSIAISQGLYSYSSILFAQIASTSVSMRLLISDFTTFLQFGKILWLSFAIIYLNSMVHYDMTWKMPSSYCLLTSFHFVRFAEGGMHKAKGVMHGLL